MSQTDSSVLETDSRETITKAEQTKRTRALIIDTGIRCLANYGFNQTSMHLISKEAGISRGPLSYHFKDKNDLMGAIAGALPMGARNEVIVGLHKLSDVNARLDMILTLAIDQHLGMHHFVAVELLVAARQDVDLANAIRPHFETAEHQLDDWFCGFLADLGWADEHLVAYRTVMVAALRGLALDHVLQLDSKAHQNALMMFKAIFKLASTSSSQLGFKS